MVHLPAADWLQIRLTATDADDADVEDGMAAAVAVAM